MLALYVNNGGGLNS